MNEAPNTTPTPALPSSTALESPSLQFAEALRRFLACNPFYFLSAALLLYSCYRISSEPGFLRTEPAQLSFNLLSLQVYEWLVIGTAIFLASRAVWYDSTLLVGLENMLLLVPFILISQAALIDSRLVWVLCVAGAVLAAARLGLLKRGIRQLNFPTRLLGLGGVILLANAALPVAYRILHQSKVGTKPDWGAAFETNQWVWWLGLPLLCASAWTLPRTPRAGRLWPERGWLPAGLFGLWLLGTGVHCYCLGYVYDFTLRADLLAPTVWVLAWVLASRIGDILPDILPAVRNSFWILPMLATLLAAQELCHEVFFALTLLNALAFAWIYGRQGRPPIALHLFLLSLTALIGGVPANWAPGLLAQFGREKLLAAGGIGYLLFCIAQSRSPKLGLVGGLLAALAAGGLAKEPNAVHWIVQAGVVFLLAHSLRWNDAVEPGAGAVRWVGALGWVSHSFLWAHFDGAGWTPTWIALPVLAAAFADGWFRGRRSPVAVPAAALLVVLSEPAHLAITQVQAAPAGLLAVTASFALFGLGTLAAVTKHRWLAR